MVLKSSKEMEAEKAKKEDSEKEILKVAADAEKAKKEDDADVKKEAVDAKDEHMDKCKHCGKDAKADVEKAGAAGLDPKEAEDISNTASSTSSPGLKTPSQPQQMLAGNSGTNIARVQNVPVQVPMSKGLNEPMDLNKSPVFLEMSKQLNEMQKSFSSQLVELKKEFSEVKELKKSVDEAKASIKEFYGQSFRKHIQEDASNLEKSAKAEETESFTEMMKKGGIKWS